MSEDKKVPDASVQKSIDEEFAELEREIARITALPAGRTDEQLALLNALRAAWAERTGGEARAEWQKRVEAALGSAIERVIADGHAVDAKGNMTFKVDAAALKKSAAPVWSALIDGLQHALQQKMDSMPKAPSKPQDSAEKPPATSNKPQEPPKPIENLKIDLTGLLSTLFKPAPKGDKK